VPSIRAYIVAIALALVLMLSCLTYTNDDGSTAAQTNSTSESVIINTTIGNSIEQVVSDQEKVFAEKKMLESQGSNVTVVVNGENNFQGKDHEFVDRLIGYVVGNGEGPNAPGAVRNMDSNGPQQPTGMSRGQPGNAPAQPLPMHPVQSIAPATENETARTEQSATVIEEKSTEDTATEETVQTAESNVTAVETETTSAANDSSNLNSTSPANTSEYRAYVIALAKEVYGVVPASVAAALSRYVDTDAVDEYVPDNGKEDADVGGDDNIVIVEDDDEDEIPETPASFFDAADNFVDAEVPLVATENVDTDAGWFSFISVAGNGF
jgi:hypothetical protein